MSRQKLESNARDLNNAINKVIKIYDYLPANYKRYAVDKLSDILQDLGEFVKYIERRSNDRRQ